LAQNLKTRLVALKHRTSSTKKTDQQFSEVLTMVKFQLVSYFIFKSFTQCLRQTSEVTTVKHGT